LRRVTICQAGWKEGWTNRSILTGAALVGTALLSIGAVAAYVVKTAPVFSHAVSMDHKPGRRIPVRDGKRVLPDPPKGGTQVNG
jgi:hypothetical protein